MDASTPTREIFGLEMERIFSKVWVYVGHESQVANPGDYMTGYLAQQPIILTRDRAGQIHVLFNRCTHRGAKIVNRERGNERLLTCMYHGWAFGHDGELRGIPLKGISRRGGRTVQGKPGPTTTRGRVSRIHLREPESRCGAAPRLPGSSRLRDRRNR